MNRWVLVWIHVFKGDTQTKTLKRVFADHIQSAFSSIHVLFSMYWHHSWHTVLTFSNYDCSNSELFQNLKRSKLVHQRAVSKAIMMHSIVNNTAPEYLTSRFVRRCDLTSYNLRENEYKLAVPQPRTEFYKRSLSYSGSVLWNSLPLEVRQLTSPSIFKGNWET